MTALTLLNTPLSEKSFILFKKILSHIFVSSSESEKKKVQVLCYYHYLSVL